MDYMNDLEIDSNKLNSEVIKQPILNMQYIELFAKASDELNEQKRKVKIVESELKEKYAELYLFNKSSGEKITEKENESMILISPEYKKVQNHYFNQIKIMNDFENEVIIMDGVVKSFQQRKNSLEKAIDLYISGYNGDIRQPKPEILSEAKSNALNKLKGGNNE
jgi:hypothetical protein